MEALRSGQNSGGFPPSALPLTTSTAVNPPVAATAISSPSIAPVAGLPAEASATTLVEPPITEPSLTPTDAPTPEPSATIAPPTATPEATLALPTQVPLSNEQRWRAQEIDRVVFDPMRSYTTVSSELWWYDPVNQQHVILGTFTGSFVAQARFTLRGQGVEALEVPYQVNRSYGLTALSSALVDRIKAAGNNDWIETYVFVTPNVTPR
jgi:hypothetical protein